MYIRALVIDDNMMDRLILTKLLREEKCITIECADAFEALEKVESHVVDIIFMDIKMPGVSGFDLLKRLKSFCERNAIPIVMVSGTRLDKTSVVRAIKNGAVDFMVKPITPQTLAQKIEKIKQEHEFRANDRLTLPEKNTSTLHSDCELISVDAYGLVIKTKMTYTIGQSILFNNSFLNSYNIKDLPVIVIECEKKDDTNHVYLSFEQLPGLLAVKMNKMYQYLKENYKNNPLNRRGESLESANS